MLEVAEVNGLRDQIIQSARMGLMKEQSTESPVKVKGCLKGLGICEQLNTYEEFEEYLRNCRRARQRPEAAPELQQLESEYAAQQVEETFQRLRFAVMMLNVLRCPC